MSTVTEQRHRAKKTKTKVSSSSCEDFPSCEFPSSAPVDTASSAGHNKTIKGRSKKISKSKASPILPVTLLSGFLGAGKTTLLKHILESNNHRRKIAVIVNDMASLNVDASFISKTGLIESQEEFITMQNGCICCTLRADLLKAIQRIQAMNSFDYIVIESTGISEPMQVAETFCIDPQTVELANEEEKMLFRNTARLDTCVTVIDAFEFPRMIQSMDNFIEKFPMERTSKVDEGDAEETKNIAQLLIEQVEFANVILLNKMDLVSPTEREEALQLVRTLNPKAKVIPTTQSKVDLDEVLDTHLFDLEEASTAAGWLQSLSSLKKGDSKLTMKSERDEYDVYSFVYRARRPFHPFRLHRFIQDHFAFLSSWHSRPTAGAGQHHPQCANNVKGQLLRSKGFCWVASQNDSMVEWNHTGRLLSLTPAMSWYSDVPEEEWNLTLEEEKQIVRQDILPNQYGDRRQEIVFIGIKLHEAQWTAALDACLLTEEEFQHFDTLPAEHFYDPLPIWIADIQDQSALSFVVRKEQQARISIGETVTVDLTQAALHIRNTDIDFLESTLQGGQHQDFDLSKLTVKLWLDQVLDRKVMTTALLCTLRPFQVEQFGIDATLLPSTDEEKDQAVMYCLRMEVDYVESTSLHGFLSNQRKRKLSGDDIVEAMKQLMEVHVVAVSRATEDKKEEDEHNHDHDHDNDNEDDE